MGGKRRDNRIDTALDVVDALSVIDTSLTREVYDKDALSKRDGSVKSVLKKEGQYSHAGNVSVLSSASRRSQVEYLLLSGLTPTSIAREIGCDPITVMRDVEYLREVQSHSPSVDVLRSTMTRTFLGMMQVAESRYMLGGEGATVEGRLVVDLGARIAKMHGIDDSVLSQEVAPALARLFEAMADNVDSRTESVVDLP